MKQKQRGLIKTKKNVTVSKLDRVISSPKLVLAQLLFVFTCFSLTSLTPQRLFAQNHLNPAAAHTSTIKSSDAQVEKNHKNDIQPFLTSELSYGRSLYDHKDGSLSEANSVSLRPGVSLSNNYSLSALFEYSQDLRQEEKSDFSDLTLYLNKTFKPTRLSSSHQRVFGLTGSVVTPISKSSTYNSSLLGAGSITGSMTLSSTTSTDWGYAVSLGVSAIKFVHQYETTLAGKSNSSYGSNQILDFKFSAGRWSLSLNFTHRLRLSYDDKNKNNFVHSEELAYEFNNNLYLALGHTLEGITQKPTGENNIIGIDEDNSQVYVTLGISI